jgi:hypothetical protein
MRITGKVVAEHLESSVRGQKPPSHADVTFVDNAHYAALHTAYHAARRRERCLLPAQWAPDRRRRAQE